MKTQLVPFLVILVSLFSCKPAKDARKTPTFQFIDSECNKYHNLIQQFPSQIFMEDTNSGNREEVELNKFNVGSDINFNSLSLLDKFYLRHWEITHSDSLILVFKNYLEKLENDKSYYYFNGYSLQPLPWRKMGGVYQDGKLTFYYEVQNITDNLYKTQDSLIGFMPNYMDDGNCFCESINRKEIKRKSSKKCRQNLPFILGEFNKSKYNFTNLISNIMIFKVKAYSSGEYYNERTNSKILDSFYMVCTRQSIIEWPQLSGGHPIGSGRMRHYIGAMYLINPKFYDYKTSLYNLSQSFFTPNQKDTFRFLEPYLRIAMTGRYSNLILSSRGLPIDNKLSKFKDLTFLGTKGKFHTYGFYSDIYNKDMIIILDTKKPENIKVKTYRAKSYVNR
jgi:hypothetical protein